MRTHLLLFALFTPVFTEISAQQVVKLMELPTGLSEVSGIFYKDGLLAMHGDGGSPTAVFRMNKAGIPTDTTSLSNSNKDWEEMGVNARVVVIGDFGNNQGSRKDLKLLMFPVDSLGKKNIVPETVNFEYPDQTDFSSNTFTDFDCEAMFIGDDTAWLFSKSKSTAVCRAYAVALAPGKQTATLTDTLLLPFWVCGAAIRNDKLLLTGYAPNWDLSLSPWIHQTGFRNGKFIRAGSISKLLSVDGSSQIESVCFGDSGMVYLAAEAYNSKPAALYSLQESSLSASVVKTGDKAPYPNPATDHIFGGSQRKGVPYRIMDSRGKLLQEGKTGENGRIGIRDLSPGNYFLETGSGCMKQKTAFTKN